jgi:hypothetical protein
LLWRYKVASNAIRFVSIDRVKLKRDPAVGFEPLDTVSILAARLESDDTPDTRVRHVGAPHRETELALVATHLTASLN